MDFFCFLFTFTCTCINTHIGTFIPQNKLIASMYNKFYIEDALNEHKIIFKQYSFNETHLLHIEYTFIYIDKCVAKENDVQLR